MSSSIEITDAGATVLLGSGEIGISGVKFYYSEDGGVTKSAATMSQTIYARAQDLGLDGVLGGGDDTSGGLVIESGAIQGSLEIGSMTFGNGDNASNDSIGTITVSNINMTGSTMTIYGH
jgi:hypothetical protein